MNFALTAGRQQTGHIAHHLLEKAVGRDAQAQHGRVRGIKFAGRRNVQRGGDDMPRGAFHVSARVLQPGKVLFSQQVGQGRAHALDIQRAAVPDKWGQLRRHKPALLPELVDVGFAQGVLAGMKIRRRGLDRQYADCRRQQGIEAAPPGQPGLGGGHVAVGHLTVGVYARIRAARRVRPHRRAGQHAQGGLQFSLNGGRRRGLFLNLPAAVASAQVSQQQFQAHQSGSLMRVIISVNLAVLAGLV